MHSRRRPVEEQITFAAKQRLKGHYDIVWCVFSAQAMNVDAGNIDEISAYAEKKKRVKLAWNAPDVSLWYLLHLQIPSEPIQDVSVITSALRGVLPGFSAECGVSAEGGLIDTPETLQREGSGRWSTHRPIMPWRPREEGNFSLFR